MKLKYFWETLASYLPWGKWNSLPLSINAYMELFTVSMTRLCYVGWDFINCFNSAIFVCLSKARTCISNIMSWSFVCSVSTVNMRGYCLFYWYWWNLWPSLLKYSFHNVSLQTPALHFFLKNLEKSEIWEWKQKICSNSLDLRLLMYD